MSIFLETLKNSTINMFALFYVVFFSVFLNKLKIKKIYKHLILSISLWFAYFIMMSSGIIINEGVIFDLRVVLSIISAFYLDLVPGIIGTIFGVSYRIYLGGVGAYGGVISIAIPYLIVTICRYKIKKVDVKNEFHVFVVAIISVVGHLVFTYPVRGIEMISPGYLIIYYLIIPVITIVVNSAFLAILKYQNLEDVILKQDLIHKASIDSIDALEIFAVDANYNYLFSNGMHENSMFKYYELTKLGSNYLEQIDTLMYERIKLNIDRAFLGESVLDVFEVEVNHGKFIEERYTPIYAEGEIIGVTIISQDVTSRIKKENELNYLSYHDILTGLKNRTYYQQVINEISLENLVYTVIYMDINGLKKVNDNYGHRYGDELILTVARELNYEFKEEKLLARIGGDEFIVIVSGSDLVDTKNKINNIITNLSKFKIQSISPSISFGYSVKEKDDDILTTIKVAEKLMYENKINSSKTKSITITDILRSMLHEYNIETNEHSLRVLDLALKIGNKLELEENEMNDLSIIANFHDIGKVVIPHNILFKEDKLTKEEWDIIKLHPEIGAKIISMVDEYKHLKDEILYHHERYDGLGYPSGLKDLEIPLLSRIISVCDAYDAMTHNRTYKKMLTKKEAIEELKKEKGKQFDPKIVDLILEILK